MNTPTLSRAGFTYLGDRNAFEYGGIWIRVEQHGWSADAIELLGRDDLDPEWSHDRALIEWGSICLERRPLREWRRILQCSGVTARDLRTLPRDLRRVRLAEAANSYLGFDRAYDSGEWARSATAAYRIVRRVAASL